MKSKLALISSHKSSPKLKKEKESKELPKTTRSSSLDLAEQNKNKTEKTKIRLFSDHKTIKKRASYTEKQKNNPIEKTNKFSTPPLDRSSARVTTKEFSLSDEHKLLERITPKKLPPRKGKKTKKKLLTKKFFFQKNFFKDFLFIFV